MEFLKIEQVSDDGRKVRYRVEFENERTREATGLAYMLMCESEMMDYGDPADVRDRLVARVGQGAVDGYLANFLTNYVASMVAETLPFFPFGRPSIMHDAVEADQKGGTVGLLIEYVRTPEYELSSYEAPVIRIPAGEVDEEAKVRLLMNELWNRFVGEVDKEDFRVVLDEMTVKLFEMLEMRSMDVQQYCKKLKMSEDDLHLSLMVSARDKFAEEMALDALYRHHGLEATAEDEEIVLMQMDADRMRGVRRRLQVTGLTHQLRQQAQRQSARRWLMGNVRYEVIEDPRGDAPEFDLEALEEAIRGFGPLGEDKDAAGAVRS